MAKRKKKHEPEMLIVSFCDIVTITTAALFFALLITVQEAVKIPVFKPTPRAKPTDKQPVFFECREGQIFYIDKAGLDEQVSSKLSTLNITTGMKAGDATSMTKLLAGVEIGNEYYRVVPSYLLTAMMALEPKTGAKGDSVETVEDAGSKFQMYLRTIKPKDQYAVFLVRDDSFHVFREARKVADRMGLDIGWELLGRDEPIKFGTGGQMVPTG